MIAWTTDYSKQVIIGFTTQSIFQLWLYAGDNNNSFLNITVRIRDTLDCFTEYNLQSIMVRPDLTAVTTLIDVVQQSGKESNSNHLIQLLASSNQNIVGQILTSLSQIFNNMNSEIVQATVDSN